ncbi:MAG TPA: hypothetical protein VM680_12695 [Verrucomicrobiae bacterium]|nr:hypothetical protein [Verrucomicrobiae bacterium]
MKTKWLLLVSVLIFSVTAAEQTWRYQLLEGGFLIDECLICGRPTFQIPMRGSFNLRKGAMSPIAQKFLIENAEFTAGPDYTFKGSGTYDLVGDFAVRQVVTLTGMLETPGGTNKVAFTNETSAPTRRWPMLQFRLAQTNGTLVSTITLDIAAAPLREIWFSTRTNFARAIKLDNTVSDGDLLSTVGRIVKRNAELQNFPGPTYLNMGLDAVDILPGGEIAFSTETKGVLNDGDFAIARTGAIRNWQDFMPLVAPGLTTDPGLDALQLEGSNKIYFSTKQDMNDGTIGHGDIVLVDTDAPTGSVFKKNADLLARFHPAVAQDYGLDAIYIWPNGEIWFSTASEFTDNELGAISDGDLLSDAGYIVYRNADLTAALQPLGEPPTNFGLDALFVISDFAATTEDVSLAVGIDRASNAALLSWKGTGRVFQLYRAADVTGPWEVWTPIMAESQLLEPLASARSFYRLRQW